MADDTFWIGDEIGPGCCTSPWTATCWDRRWNCPTPRTRPIIRWCWRTPTPRASRIRAASRPWTWPATARRWSPFSKAWSTGDPPQQLRVQRYDTAADKWLPGTLIYELDPDTLSVTDMSRIDGNRFVVVERDDLQGDAAKAKRVYAIDLDKAVPGKPLAKKLVIDLLNIGNARGLAQTAAPGAPFRFPYLTTESIQVLDRKHVVIVNDNNYPSTGGRGPSGHRRHRVDLAGARQSVVDADTRDVDRPQGRGARVRPDSPARLRVARDRRRRSHRAHRPQWHRQVFLVRCARRHAAARRRRGAAQAGPARRAGGTGAGAARGAPRCASRC